MHKGNWTCKSCGKSITELPFEPRDDNSVECFDCHKANSPRRDDRSRGAFRERKMFSGNWKCSDCGAPITELPFEPRDESTLKCRDCFRK